MLVLHLSNDKRSGCVRDQRGKQLCSGLGIRLSDMHRAKILAARKGKHKRPVFIRDRPRVADQLVRERMDYRLKKLLRSVIKPGPLGFQPNRVWVLLLMLDMSLPTKLDSQPKLSIA